MSENTCSTNCFTFHCQPTRAHSAHTLTHYIQLVSHTRDAISKRHSFLNSLVVYQQIFTQVLRPSISHICHALERRASLSAVWCVCVRLSHVAARYSFLPCQLARTCGNDTFRVRPHSNGLLHWQIRCVRVPTTAAAKVCVLQVFVRSAACGHIQLHA